MHFSQKWKNDTQLSTFKWLFEVVLVTFGGSVAPFALTWMLKIGCALLLNLICCLVLCHQVRLYCLTQCSFLKADWITAPTVYLNTDNSGCHLNWILYIFLNRHAHKNSFFCLFSVISYRWHLERKRLWKLKDHDSPVMLIWNRWVH